MPMFDYRCDACKQKTTVFFRTLSAVDHSTAVCSRCGSKKLTRLMARVRVLRGDAGDTLGPQGDVDPGLMREMDGLDESDPRALGRFMRKMSEETGEDLGPEFGEVVARLERGEDPDAIEAKMGDVFGDGPGADGTDDDGVSPSPAAEAPAPEPKAPRKRARKLRASKPKRSAKRTR
jgi:putative FmdB family regulatory protein